MDAAGQLKETLRSFLIPGKNSVARLQSKTLVSTSNRISRRSLKSSYSITESWNSLHNLIATQNHHDSRHEYYGGLEPWRLNFDISKRAMEKCHMHHSFSRFVQLANFTTNHWKSRRCTNINCSVQDIYVLRYLFQ